MPDRLTEADLTKVWTVICDAVMMPVAPRTWAEVAVRWLGRLLTEVRAAWAERGEALAWVAELETEKR